MSTSFRAFDCETAQQLTNPDAHVRTLLPYVWELKCCMKFIIENIELPNLTIRYNNYELNNVIQDFYQTFRLNGMNRMNVITKIKFQILKIEILFKLFM